MTSVDLLRSGMALVPIPPGQKGPTRRGWNLRENCVTSDYQIAHLHGMSIGLAHAYCTPAPSCALDIDQYKSAKEWLNGNGIDLEALAFAQDAVVIWSGKKNSLKLLYRLPQGINALPSQKLINSDRKTFLEFRCASHNGRTVQDVLPPSIHPNGTMYQWLGMGNPLALPEIPPALLTLWQGLLINPNRKVMQGFSAFKVSQPPIESPRQIARLKDALTYITADCPYELWRNIVWAILSTEWSCATDIASTWSQSAPDRYDEGAFYLLVNSYLPHGESQITVGTLYYFARLGGWRG